MRVLRSFVVLLAFSLLSAACGLKEGAEVSFSSGESGSMSSGDGTTVMDDGEFTDPGTTDEATTDSTAGTDTGESSSAGDTADTPAGPGPGRQPSTDDGGGDAPDDDPGQPPAAGNSTGVTADEIVIGFHAPLTGAAPLPQQSFKKGQTQYWEQRGKVYGRNVRIIIYDDKYNPSAATGVCKQLIERDKAFIMGGAGGADQIAACARVANAAGVPYVSPGVDEGVLRTLRHYFAFSMTYPQQAPLLVQWVKKHSPPSNKKFGIIKDRTPSFNAVVNSVKAEAEKAGYEVLVRQTQNGPSDAQWLVQNQIEVAFPIMSPSTWVQIVNSPGGSIKQWAGIGITMGLNQVASAACPAIDGAMFFSPFPGFNTAKQFEPKTTAEDDIQWALWGSNKLLDVIFTKMDGVLTRERFMHVLENETIDNGIYPVTKHTRNNHFTSKTVHVLRADCSKRQYESGPQDLFRSSF
jgi:branched-chain amino acid transport system substrate-binding protein